MLYGEYQAKQRNALFNYMEEKRNIEYIVDVGGHVGLWSRPMIQRANTRYIWAFEPNSSVRECYVMNMSRFDNYTIYPIALGDKNTKGYLNVEKDNSGNTNIDPIKSGDTEIKTLDSLKQYNAEHGSQWNESDFNKPTDLYRNSTALQELLQDILPYCVRTHFIKLLPGGYFPPHRDHSKGIQNTFRLIVPIQNFNPPFCRFILEDTTLYWVQNKMYFLNTCVLNKPKLDPIHDQILIKMFKLHG